MKSKHSFIVIFINLIFGIILSVSELSFWMLLQFDNYYPRHLNYEGAISLFKTIYLSILIFIVIYVFANEALFFCLKKRNIQMNGYLKKALLSTLILPVLLIIIFIIMMILWCKGDDCNKKQAFGNNKFIFQFYFGYVHCFYRKRKATKWFGIRVRILDVQATIRTISAC